LLSKNACAGKISAANKFSHFTKVVFSPLVRALYFEKCTLTIGLKCAVTAW